MLLKAEFCVVYKQFSDRVTVSQQVKFSIWRTHAEIQGLALPPFTHIEHKERTFFPLTRGVLLNERRDLVACLSADAPVTR